MQQLQSDGSYNELLPKADAWTKDETLSAQVASVLGLRNNYKPDDAFLGLYFGAGTYRYRVRVVLEDGTPVQGSTISGISAIQGQSLVTNEQGYVIGKSTSQSVTISCTSPFVDQKAPESQAITSTGIITDCVFSLASIADIIKITSSSSLNTSSLARTVDICTVGGGGGCGGWNNTGESDHGGRSSGGGGGGYSGNLMNQQITSANLKVVIGSGGAMGSLYQRYGSQVTDGADGRQTSVKINNETVLFSDGGKGGRGGSRQYPDSGLTFTPGGDGNGKGGDGHFTTFEQNNTSFNRQDGTVFLFNDSSLGLSGGGGGGGGAGVYDYYDDGYYPLGGKPNGGDGCTGWAGNDSWSHPTTSGKAFGGGCGGGSYGFSPTSGLKGGDGGVYLRFHF